MSGSGGASVAGGDQHDGTYGWHCATMHAPWRPRDGAGALSFRGALWLLGGWRPREDGATGPGDVVDTVFEGTTARYGVVTTMAPAGTACNLFAHGLVGTLLATQYTRTGCGS